MHYIYSDSVAGDVTPGSCIKLLELANRLCLPRLVALVEHKVAKDLESLGQDRCDDVVELALTLLESCQLHNSEQLADWCLYQVAVRYDQAGHKFSKSLRSLHPENQAYLNRNRWPPVWFTRELDYFERCVRERTWKEKPPKLGLKRCRLSSGCLCFSVKRQTHKKGHAH